MNDPYDPNKGHGRELFRPSELVGRTNGKCVPPCKNTIYDIEIEKSALRTISRHIQITLVTCLIERLVVTQWTCSVPSVSIAIIDVAAGLTNQIVDVLFI